MRKLGLVFRLTWRALTVDRKDIQGRTRTKDGRRGWLEKSTGDLVEMCRSKREASDVQRRASCGGEEESVSEPPWTIGEQRLTRTKEKNREGETRVVDRAACLATTQR